jgi:membrane associated rhomboid family serine protease
MSSDGGVTRRTSVNAEEVLEEARKALFVMVGFIALIWAVQVANWATDQRLSLHYGIEPRSLPHVGDIFSAPFLHASWQHIEGNSGPLFVFGFLAAYRGVRKFLMVTLLITVTSGLAVWFFQDSKTFTVGASGLVFGYFGYVVVRGLFDRHLIDVLIGCVMALSFAYLLTSALPGQSSVSWLAHAGGLVGGILAGWVFRDRTETASDSGRKGIPAGIAASAAGIHGDGLADTAILQGDGGRKKGKGGSVPGSPRSDLLKELDDLGL